MTNQSISVDRGEINRIVKQLFEATDEPARRMAAHLYKVHNYTQSQIAQIIDRDEKVVSRRYPKNGGGK